MASILRSLSLCLSLCLSTSVLPSFPSPFCPHPHQRKRGQTTDLPKHWGKRGGVTSYFHQQGACMTAQPHISLLIPSQPISSIFWEWDQNILWMPSLPRRVGEVRTSDWQGVHPDSTLGTIMFLRYHWKIWKHPRNPGHSWPEQWRQQRARVGVTDILSSHSPFFLSFFLSPLFLAFCTQLLLSPLLPP